MSLDDFDTPKFKEIKNSFFSRLRLGQILQIVEESEDRPFWYFGTKVLSAEEVQEFQPRDGVFWSGLGEEVAPIEVLTNKQTGLLIDKNGRHISRVTKLIAKNYPTLKRLANSDEDYKLLSNKYLQRRSFEHKGNRAIELELTFLSDEIESLMNEYLEYNPGIQDGKVDLIISAEGYIEFLRNFSDHRYNNLHPKRDVNYWGSFEYEFFKYLYENYYLARNDRRKKHLINIWFFLKDNKHRYLISPTKKEYCKMLENCYGVKITNMSPSKHYVSQEFIKLDQLEKNFRDGRKAK